jgi:hypothetical protein
MAMAAQPVIFQNYGSSSDERIALETQATEDIERIVLLEETKYMSMIVDNPMTREAQLLDLRIRDLKRNSVIFGIASALFLLASIVTVLVGFAWQPPVASFFSVFGTFVVFRMKLRDARR